MEGCYRLSAISLFIIAFICFDFAISLGWLDNGFRLIGEFCGEIALVVTQCMGLSTLRPNLVLLLSWPTACCS